jgi:hypothetical protein
MGRVGDRAVRLAGAGECEYAGRFAVELTMRDGTRLRLGTDEPEALAQAISRARSDAPDGQSPRGAEA